MKNDLRENPATGEEMATVSISPPVQAANAKPASVAHWPGSRIFWLGDVARPMPAVMAVVGAQGDLVPLRTAGDLLRAFKTIWRTGDGN